jgi:cystathionine beta-lyase
VLLPDNAYGPNKEWVRGELARWGIAHRYYDPLDARGTAAMMSVRTRLLWLEAAGSVTLEFPDLRGLTRAARERGVLVALDNTWGAGLAFNPFAYGEAADPASLGADISVHALTKYPSGGGDVLMGSVTTLDEALHLRLKATHMRLGLGVGVNDVELVLRALPSLPLRYAAHDAGTRALASWMITQPEVKTVLHPALSTSPGHGHWREVCSAAAGLFSVVFHERHDAARVDAFIDALRLFKIGYSWGGPMSLAVPYEVGGMRSLGWTQGGPLVRFAVGLERVEDLQADLDQALRKTLRAG